MPLYIDIHEVPGVTTEAAAAAHIRDIDVQTPYGVDFEKYWINEQSGKIFCLCEAPNIEAAMAVHREAHGVVADRIIEVTPELTEMFMGSAPTDASGAVLLPAQHPRAHDNGLRTVVFTDIVGSTSLTQSLGDDGAMRLLLVHDRIVREAIAATEGREVKHTGDGIMAAFYSPVAAIRCAIQAQTALAAHNAEHPDMAFHMRIGAAIGEPVERHNDLFGATVQLAARLCAHAEPAQILVSSVVADLCLGKGVMFHDLGSIALKGFDEPAPVRVVEWRPAVSSPT
jgi:class 3 adenylate cyclase